MVRVVALLGSGGHCSDILDTLFYLAQDGSSQEDRVLIASDDAHPYPLLRDGRVSYEQSMMSALAKADEYILAVGYPRTRQQIFAASGASTHSPRMPLVHPLAYVSASAETGDGTFIQGFAWLSPGVQIGDHVYVGYGAKIGHGTRVGDFSSIMPGAFIGGDVTCGRGVMVGANASVLQGLKLGENCAVGAGAVVTRDVPAGRVVAGAPGRPLDND